VSTKTNHLKLKCFEERTETLLTLSHPPAHWMRHSYFSCSSPMSLVAQSVGIVRMRTQAMEFSLVLVLCHAQCAVIF
jgi:hypothetical protein